MQFKRNLLHLMCYLSCNLQTSLTFNKNEIYSLNFESGWCFFEITNTMFYLIKKKIMRVRIYIGCMYRC